MKLFFLNNEFQGRKLNLPIVGVVQVAEDNSIECKDEDAEQLITILKGSPSELGAKRLTPEDVVKSMDVNQLREYITQNEEEPKINVMEAKIKALRRYVLKLIGSEE